MQNRKSAIPVLVLVFLVVLLVWFFRTHYVSTKSNPVLKTHEAHVGPPDIYPDPLRTPGAVNPDITQQNIRETIGFLLGRCGVSVGSCRSRVLAGYTASTHADAVAVNAFFRD